MIYNGNYKNAISEELLKIILESFVEFYGVDYQKYLEKTFNDFDIEIYHTKDEIIKYYKKYLEKFRDKIIDRFYKKAKLKRSDTLDKVLFGEEEFLCESNLDWACEGGAYFTQNNILTKESKSIIQKNRQRITNALKLSCDRERNYNKLISLRKKLVESIKEIEDENNCDVFDDMRNIVKNMKNTFVDFLEDVNDFVEVSENDKNFLKSDDFDLYYSNFLDCDKILFNGDLNNDGLVSVFTDEANDTMKKGSNQEKLEIIINRLMYLNCVGIETNIKNSKLIEYLDKIDDFDENKDIWAYEIYKEYNYQKSRKIENKFIKNISQAEFEKSWKTGNFIPSEIADNLECLRKYYSDKIEENTKFPKLTLGKSINFDCFTQKSFKDKYIFKPFNKIIVSEDIATEEPDFYLQLLIHEINHAVSIESPYKISNKNSTMKNSLSYNGYSHKNFIIKNRISSSETLELEEFVNQMQALEILEIVKRKMNEKNLKIETDDIEKTTGNNCIYDYYAILAMPFYNQFREQLKLQNIDPTYRLYFDFNLPFNHVQIITERLKDKMSRTFDINYSNRGSVDFYKAEELSKLIKKLDEDILPEVFENNISIDDFLAGKTDSLSSESKIELAKLKEKAEKVMYKIYEDEVRFKGNKDKTI